MTLAQSLRDEGRREAKLEIAIRLLKLKIDEKIIAEVTNISINEIEKLKNKG